MLNQPPVLDKQRSFAGRRTRAAGETKQVVTTPTVRKPRPKEGSFVNAADRLHILTDWLQARSKFVEETLQIVAGSLHRPAKPLAPARHVLAESLHLLTEPFTRAIHSFPEPVHVALDLRSVILDPVRIRFRSPCQRLVSCGCPTAPFCPAIYDLFMSNAPAGPVIDLPSPIPCCSGYFVGETIEIPAQIVERLLQCGYGRRAGVLRDAHLSCFDPRSFVICAGERTRHPGASDEPQQNRANHQRSSHENPPRGRRHADHTPMNTEKCAH